MPSTVRITDSAGALVAEFTGPSPQAADSVIAFWREQLPGEALTVERDQAVSGPPPAAWSARAMPVYAREAAT